jgi:Flp pilus assembly protein TadD
MEPRSVGIRYLLGATYLNAGHIAEARKELATAHGLAPRDPIVEAALRRAKRGG